MQDFNLHISIKVHEKFLTYAVNVKSYVEIKLYMWNANLFLWNTGILMGVKEYKER